MRKFLIVAGLVLVVATVVWAADLSSNIKPMACIWNTSVSNNDNTDGSIIDSLGYKSVTYIIQTATLADSDATLTPSIIAGDDSGLSDGVAATTGQLIGTIAGATFAAADDNTVKKLGYSGPKRYTRLRITPANNTSAADFAAIGILGHPKRGPVAQ